MWQSSCIVVGAQGAGALSSNYLSAFDLNLFLCLDLIYFPKLAALYNDNDLFKPWENGNRNRKEENQSNELLNMN